MILIHFLSDHPDSIPTLAKWFRAQWADYYAGRTNAQMQQEFLYEASRERLPVRLIAFEAGELAGTIVLRQHGSASSAEFTPELGGLYVVESRRGRGIGTELVRAGMKLALELGYETVYATTVAAAGILEGLGWEFVHTLVHADGELGLYRWKRSAPP